MNNLLSLDEAAEYLKMSASGLRRIVDRSRSRYLAGRPDPDGIVYSQANKGERIKFKQLWLDDYIQRTSHTPLQINVQLDRAAERKPPNNSAQLPKELECFGW